MSRLSVLSALRSRPRLAALAAKLYAVAVDIDRWSYSSGLRHRYTFDGRKVIAVGNVEWGGTGKTPMAAWLALRYASAATPLAIVSAARDEAAMLATECQTQHATVVAVPPGARKAAYAAAVVPSAVSTLVFDDACQHWPLVPHVAIGMVNPLSPHGMPHPRCAARSLAPLGTHRERAARWLASLDLVIIHHAQIAASEQRLPAAISNLEAYSVAPDKRVFSRMSDPVFRHHTEAVKAPSSPLLTSPLLLSGLGSPQAFEATIAASLPTTSHLVHAIYDDHHAWTAAEANALVTDAAHAGHSALLLSAKDWARSGGVLTAAAESVGLPLVTASAVLQISSSATDWSAAAQAQGAAIVDSVTGLLPDGRSS
ncbi:uncharacterized protein AMSG_00855 [Thecamonas trahens ATCC 50062]|uniref:tetraacyldisaccharide 4'-kinase n=1 Tax=Thecamonas trahens ATCC 50062 TaxID=461836 RepID=A0A0L0DEE0_THETB|nr:hypothetical protein AMSG_00855 [Thecamonas trahens ATCC 50062]KNC50697.1 hypothetical protein AMSG_00855 [Thecamonas trahens ATCC 50062]|eukprot:XP_013762574.1 hypothetical protein AMSG_00855 [Thecamonas trahens ATCC 50062]